MITVPWYIAALCLWGTASIAATLGALFMAICAVGGEADEALGQIPGRWYYP